ITTYCDDVISSKKYCLQVILATSNVCCACDGICTNTNKALVRSSRVFTAPSIGLSALPPKALELSPPMSAFCQKQTFMALDHVLTHGLEISGQFRQIRCRESWVSQRHQRACVREAR